jgi:hypothetical protein
MVRIPEVVGSNPLVVQEAFFYFISISLNFENMKKTASSLQKANKQDNSVGGKVKRREATKDFNAKLKEAAKLEAVKQLDEIYRCFEGNEFVAKHYYDDDGKLLREFSANPGTTKKYIQQVLHYRTWLIKEHGDDEALETISESSLTHLDSFILFKNIEMSQTKDRAWFNMACIKAFYADSRIHSRGNMPWVQEGCIGNPCLSRKIEGCMNFVKSFTKGDISSSAIPFTLENLGQFQEFLSTDSSLDSKQIKLMGALVSLLWYCWLRVGEAKGLRVGHLVEKLGKRGLRATPGVSEAELRYTDLLIKSRKTDQGGKGILEFNNHKVHTTNCTIRITNLRSRFILVFRTGSRNISSWQKTCLARTTLRQNLTPFLFSPD